MFFFSFLQAVSFSLRLCCEIFFPFIQVNMKMRRERFLDVPLCATDCDDWFHACKDDYTCTDNWTLNFKWINGTNHCRPESECRTFSDIFQNSSNFCERVESIIIYFPQILINKIIFFKVWDHSWKYTSNSEPCMRIWFDGNQGNPNENVARWKIQQSNRAESFSVMPFSFMLPALIITSKLLV